MADEPTELDKRRGEYARQILQRCRVGKTDADYDSVMWSVDHLLLEWGADAYRQGESHVADRIAKYASGFVKKHQ